MLVLVGVSRDGLGVSRGGVVSGGNGGISRNV